MEQVTATSNVSACASAILKRVDILSNPYFISMQDGTMTLEQFRRSQEQFYYAVSFFSRPMAALVGRIPDPRDRLDILHNVLEEHGDSKEEQFHANTFQRFLQSIGSTADLDHGVVSPQIRAFNSVITTACTFDEMEVGVGCMGMIELAFADISSAVAKAVVERGWVKENELVHYKLHAQIDSRHAEDFFRVVEKSWSDQRKQYYIKQGLELGAYIFDRLYKDLPDARSVDCAE